MRPSFSRRIPNPLPILVLPLLVSLGIGLLAAPAEAEGESPPQFGDPAQAELVLIGSEADGLNLPRDLAFHPDRPNELWTVNRTDDSTVIYFDAGTAEQRIDKRIDRYAYHFMEEVSAIAFGAENTFATCQESRNTYNNQAQPNDFMGPTLWPADLAIYARVKQADLGLTDAQIDAIMRGGLCGLQAEDGTDQDRCTLGSHIDMNHQSPNCMGIEHQADNRYWVMDGMAGHIVYYDFAIDHGPGCDDHSDATVRRYPEAEVEYIPDVPSHLAFDPESGWLYYVDTGGGRVLRLDTASGEKARNLGRTNETLAEFSEYRDVTIEILAEGLDQPSGLALHGGTLFVSQHATGEILALDPDSGAELGRLATGAEGIMGLAVGPDEKLYYVNGLANQLVRIDPNGEAPTAEPPTQEPPPVPTDTATPEPTPTEAASPTPVRFYGYLPRLERDG
jgi:DNA-binding beta-propeller fold protein YncE